MQSFTNLPDFAERQWLSQDQILLAEKGFQKLLVLSPKGFREPHEQVFKGLCNSI
jgi:hypothetical protein